MSLRQSQIVRPFIWFAELIFIGFHVLVAYGAVDKSSVQAVRLQKEFLEQSYHVVYKIEDISPSVLNIFDVGYRSIANPDELYQSTDQLDLSLPAAQLIYAGKSNGSIFVFYVVGGFGRQYELLVAQTRNEKVFSYCRYIVGSIGRLGLDDLKQDFSERKMSSARCFPNKFDE